MKKYIVRYNVTIEHEIEIEAESDTDAKDIAKSLPHSDIVQDCADHFDGDFSRASVDVEDIMDENGQYVYDGIGML